MINDRGLFFSPVKTHKVAKSSSVKNILALATGVSNLFFEKGKQSEKQECRFWVFTLIALSNYMI